MPFKYFNSYGSENRKMFRKFVTDEKNLRVHYRQTEERRWWEINPAKGRWKLTQLFDVWGADPLLFQVQRLMNYPQHFKLMYGSLSNTQDRHPKSYNLNSNRADTESVYLEPN